MRRLLLVLVLSLPLLPRPAHASAALPPVCIGDGTTGLRVQVVYARPSNAPDRFAAVRPLLREQAGVADGVFHESALETGGDRRIRYVHEPLCGPVTVEHAVVGPSDASQFPRTVDALRRLGHTRLDRLYMVFLDADPPFCAFGHFNADDRPTANTADLGNRFGVMSSRCWDGVTAAHELMHNLGGVQASAPHATGGGHCTDEWDVMCIDDDGAGPVQVSVACGDGGHDRLFDCNHDDYFHTDPPPGSYLDTHWNAADSLFLVRRSSASPP